MYYVGETVDTYWFNVYVCETADIGCEPVNCMLIGCVSLVEMWL